MKTLEAGQTAPTFQLLDQENHLISLTQFSEKKVLIYFYPKAMTPGCTVQAQALRDHQDQWFDNNLVILGISSDSVQRLTKFAQRDRLNFTLLSDENHQVAELFGVWGEKKFMGKTYDGLHRVSFLINEQGIIEQVFNKFKTKEHHQIILNHLNLQAK